MNEPTFGRADALNLLRASGAGPALVGHCQTVADVALRIGRRAQRDHPDLDLRLVELGALLHDIGKARTSEIDHASLGGQIIRSARTSIADDDFRERLAHLVEVHTGAGLDRETVRRLNVERGLHIPERDYVPETHEEIIVALADKLVSGECERSFDAQVEEKRREFGPDSQMVLQLEAWRSRYGKYLDERG